MDLLQQYIKAQLMLAACVQAAASVGVAAGDDGKLAVDDNVADPELRAKNALVYETAKIHYNVLVKAFQDKTGVWPDPKVSLPMLEGLLPKIPDLLAAIAPGTKALSIVNAALALFGVKAPAASPAPQPKPLGSDL